MSLFLSSILSQSSPEISRRGNCQGRTPQLPRLLFTSLAYYPTIFFAPTHLFLLLNFPTHTSQYLGLHHQPIIPILSLSTTMDFIKNAVGGQGANENNNNNQGENTQSNDQQSSGGGGGFLSGIGNKLNSAAGGGKESEKNEDYLDKGACYITIITIAILTSPTQASMRYSNTAWARVIRATSQRWSKRRTSRYRISFGSSIRVRRGMMFPLRIRRRDLGEWKKRQGDRMQEGEEDRYGMLCQD